MSLRHHRSFRPGLSLIEVMVSLSLCASLLVVAGAIAGMFPARRAAAIRPVEALRDE